MVQKPPRFAVFGTLFVYTWWKKWSFPHCQRHSLPSRPPVRARVPDSLEDMHVTLPCVKKVKINDVILISRVRLDNRNPLIFKSKFLIQCQIIIVERISFYKYMVLRNHVFIKKKQYIFVFHLFKIQLVLVSWCCS